MWGEPRRNGLEQLHPLISTHSPCVGRTSSDPVWFEHFLISTHSPRVGRTIVAIDPIVIVDDFNSLAPCGANREAFGLTDNDNGISTHSPRAGRTLRFYDRQTCPFYFNSLAPCGANHPHRHQTNKQHTFQLTRPVRGEPRIVEHNLLLMIISTHSPRAGRTSIVSVCSTLHYDFNSLAPCGANPEIFRYLHSGIRFQLTRPVRGEPRTLSNVSTLSIISTHSPRAGRTCMTY